MVLQGRGEDRLLVVFPAINSGGGERIVFVLGETREAVCDAVVKELVPLAMDLGSVGVEQGGDGGNRCAARVANLAQRR